jgi:hypothetical protein
MLYLLNVQIASCLSKGAGIAVPAECTDSLMSE